MFGAWRSFSLTTSLPSPAAFPDGKRLRACVAVLGSSLTLRMALTLTTAPSSSPLFPVLSSNWDSSRYVSFYRLSGRTEIPPHPQTPTRPHPASRIDQEILVRSFPRVLDSSREPPHPKLPHAHHSVRLWSFSIPRLIVSSSPRFVARKPPHPDAHTETTHRVVSTIHLHSGRSWRLSVSVGPGYRAGFGRGVGGPALPAFSCTGAPCWACRGRGWPVRWRPARCGWP